MMKCPQCKSEKTIKNGRTPNKRDQKYLCKSCKNNFLETAGTVYFGKHIDYSKIDQIVVSHCEGVGIRSMGRIFNVSPFTVSSIIKDAGSYAAEVNDSIVKGIEPTELQFDEMWTFVQKKVFR